MAKRKIWLLVHLQPSLGSEICSTYYDATRVNETAKVCGENIARRVYHPSRVEERWTALVHDRQSFNPCNGTLRGNDVAQWLRMRYGEENFEDMEHPYYSHFSEESEITALTESDDPESDDLDIIEPLAFLLRSPLFPCVDEYLVNWYANEKIFSDFKALKSWGAEFGIVGRSKKYDTTLPRKRTEVAELDHRKPDYSTRFEDYDTEATASAMLQFIQRGLSNHQHGEFSSPEDNLEEFFWNSLPLLLPSMQSTEAQSFRSKMADLWTSAVGNAGSFSTPALLTGRALYTAATDRSWIKLERKLDGDTRRLILFDVGAGARYDTGDGGSSTKWLLESYNRNGWSVEDFAEVHLWEKAHGDDLDYDLGESKLRRWYEESLVEHFKVRQVLTEFHFHGEFFKVEDGLLELIAEKCYTDVFCVVKLDIDDPVREMALVQRMMTESDGGALIGNVGEFLWEPHTHVLFNLNMQRSDGFSVGDFANPYELLGRMRRDFGVRSHGWI